MTDSIATQMANQTWTPVKLKYCYPQLLVEPLHVIDPPTIPVTSYAAVDVVALLLQSGGGVLPLEYHPTETLVLVPEIIPIVDIDAIVASFGGQ